MLHSLILFVTLSLLPGFARAEAPGGPAHELPAYHVADAGAAPVEERNLLASERFWPYQVALAKPWRPPGRPEPLAAGVAGVLIRVEESGRARIDFGRDGLYAVPVGLTDLVENANRIRLGELDKMAPNFVLDIGPRLVDAASESLRPFGLRAAAERSLFLCVFADPGAPGFGELAAALAPLRGRAGLLTILFAQGSHPDPRLREQLRGLGWPTPFVSDHLAEPYTRSLLAEGTPPPALMLASREGRLWFVGSWEPDALPELLAALERAECASGPMPAEVR